MKRQKCMQVFLCAGLTVSMMFGMAACGAESSGENDGSSEPAAEVTQQPEEGTDEQEEETVEAEQMDAKQDTAETYGTVTEANPIVETKYGKVQGRTEDGVAGFRNIPYGGEVEGDGRFQRAGEPQPWSDVRDCTITGPRAVQTVGLSGHGNLFLTRVGDYFAGGRIGELGLNDQMDSENCLNLNVLTPGVDDNKRPVMVYIHGGAFVEGSNAISAGAYGLPRDEDVVLVAVNHRLNGFGFLYLGGFDEKYQDSGNIGMLDLVMALEWVRDNIEAFGGDPENVTIFGESGGGAKVTALALMEEAEGLFHKAIIQSGTYSAFKTKEQATENAREVLETLGISEDELDKLAEIPTGELFAAMGSNYAPVVDDVNLKGNPYDPDFSTDIMQVSNDVPMLIGTDTEEMKWLSGEGNRDLFEIESSELEERLEPILGEDTKVVLEGYLNAYPDYSASDIYFKISTDNRFGKNSTYLTELKAAQNGAPVYKYLYDHVCPIENGLYGAYHTAELPLIMRLVMYEEDELMSKTLAAMWAGFARNGNPSTDSIEWPEYTLDSRNTMILDDVCEVVSDPEKDVRELWETLR